MTKQVRVNVATLVNASKIRREKRDGRDVIVVPSATLPDNVVMNKIRYPAPAIAASYKSLEGRPAPLGHPMVNGQFVSASSPAGIVRGFVGAHNENVRQENGRVLVDKVIDVAFANQSEGGRRVLDAIDKQKPIHTSTGLLATLNVLTNDPHADFEVDSMILDHDCLLLDEPGAATPEQGVGIFVNSAGDKIDVINSSIEDDADGSLDAIFRDVETKQRLGLLKLARNYINKLVQGGPTPDAPAGDGPSDEEVTMDKAQFDELSGKVAALSDGLAGLDDKIATAVGNALKPIVDAQTARDKADKDRADAEHGTLVNQVVEAGLLDETLAKASPAPVLNALLEKHKTPAAAFRVNGAFKPTGTTERKPLALSGE